jgi:hypothetical protein
MSFENHDDGGVPYLSVSYVVREVEQKPGRCERAADDHQSGGCLPRHIPELERSAEAREFRRFPDRSPARMSIRLAPADD